MIKTFRHAGLEKFFRSDSKAGIQSHHANKLRVQLTALNEAKGPSDMAAPLSWGLEIASAARRRTALVDPGRRQLSFNLHF